MHSNCRNIKSFAKVQTNKQKLTMLQGSSKLGSLKPIMVIDPFSNFEREDSI